MEHLLRSYLINDAFLSFFVIFKTQKNFFLCLFGFPKKCFRPSRELIKFWCLFDPWRTHSSTKIKLVLRKSHNEREDEEKKTTAPKISLTTSTHNKRRIRNCLYNMEKYDKRWVRSGCMDVCVDVCYHIKHLFLFCLYTLAPSSSYNISRVFVIVVV
jgi:hypothetical protein